MKRVARTSVSLIALPLATGVPAQTGTPPYTLQPAVDGTVTLMRGAAGTIYRPVFTIVRTERDPGLTLSGFASTPGEQLGGAPSNAENYPIPNWRKADGTTTDVIYDAGAVTTLTAVTSRALPGGGVAWTFKPQRDFTLSAELRPVPGHAPAIRWSFAARTPAWYSVGYTGGPASDPAAADGFLQPLIWQGKRFPRAALTTGEHMGGLPLTLVTQDGVTNGLSVDPGESPYRLPVLANARFGVVLRNAAGQAQPAAFAPLLGGAGSRFAAGQQASFTVRPLLVTGDWYATFTEAARDLFGFRDLRENAVGSLNATIDGMTEFAMDDARAGWDADLRGFAYDTDVDRSVKVVSALHPLSIALIQDDPDIYRRRARPVTEFLMSRTKYLYNADPGEAGQNAARDMKGPAAEVSELAELHALSRGQSPVFEHYARALAGKPRQLNLLMTSSGESFWDKLALYRLTRRPEDLAAARTLADAHVARRVTAAPTDFADVQIATGGQFWSDFTPNWVALFELWQETRERRYLDAAAQGARAYASFAWFFPSVPATDVTVDQGGVAPVGFFRATPQDRGIPTPPQTLPAWRVSNIGLTPEAQTTYHLNPAVFLAPQAPYQLRIAAATGDPFLHDVARWAIVGRYRSYPGYDINVTFSDVYARADYPDRPLSELNFNEIYYNHVWPHIVLLIDYLVSDFEMRSAGAIAFPSRYAQGYAYLRSKVYGDRPGSFMGDADVRLWMPRGIVAADDPQANHLTGYGNGRFYVALTNESATARDVTLRLDRERVPYVPGRAYRARVWRDGKPAGTTTVVDGRVTLPLAPKGLTAIAIDDMPVFTRLHRSYFDTAPIRAGERTHRTDPTAAGTVAGMLLNFADQRDLYVWSGASDSDVASVEMGFEEGARRRTLTDARHPFEFSLPVTGAAKVRYRLTFQRKDGRVVTTENYELTPGS